MRTSIGKLKGHDKTINCFKAFMTAFFFVGSTINIQKPPPPAPLTLPATAPGLVVHFKSMFNDSW